MSYIDASDLVFNNDIVNGINSGGFNVNSLLMKRGISPIVTLNTSPSQNGGDKVSDIFNDLVVPNWALYNPGKLTGGSSIIRPKNTTNNSNNSDSDSDSDDALDDTLHDNLLDMVKHHDTANNIKKKNTKKARTLSKNKVTKKKLNRVKQL
jgi:hypothetical protein